MTRPFKPPRPLDYEGLNRMAGNLKPDERLIVTKTDDDVMTIRLERQPA